MEGGGVNVGACFRVRRQRGIDGSPPMFRGDQVPRGKRMGTNPNRNNCANRQQRFAFASSIAGDGLHIHMLLHS
jgi:hypothetical protein